MRIFYGKGAYRRSNGNLPELKLINMLVEQSPVDEEGVILLSRKGLGELDDLGSSVSGIFEEDGVFDGQQFAVTGTSGPVSFAASATELGICANGKIYRYDGTSTTEVSFPDNANVRKILYHDGLFFAIRDGTDKFYASAVLDLTDWEALSFKSAESAPDQLLDGEVLEDALIWFGSKSIEVWQNDDSGDTVPYSRADNVTIDKGVRDTGCLVKIDQGLWFVSNENTVLAYRAGAPERVSDHGIEERLARATSVKCFPYIDEGHSIVCVRTNEGTWGLDIATGEWHEMQTLGLSNMLAQCATPPGATPIFGGSDGKVYGFNGWMDGDYPLERRFTAGIPLDGGTLSVDTLALTANPGSTSDLTLEPVVEMRSSRDGGRTWGAWRPQPLGQQGRYRTRQRWRRLGLFDEPGALFEFRTTDNCGFRVSAVRANDEGGGRSR